MTDMEEPSLLMLRSDKEAPKCVNSITESEKTDPKRAKPKRDKVEPKRQ
jgi:hypothetical protein